MESILQFMYLGEGKCYFERIGEFIKVGKDLQVKDISKMQFEEEEDNVVEDGVNKSEPGSECKIRQTKSLNQISSDAKSTECPECGKVFTEKGNMVKHLRSKHEGIKYSCNQCDYQATQQGNLQTHIAAKHSDNILQCELCDYQTKWRNHYNQHKKVHTAI